jgi:hypothetical protein
MMEQLLYKVNHFDTDGYTYASDLTVGVYSTYEKAEAAMTRYLESINYKGGTGTDSGEARLWLDNRTYIEIETFTVDEDW